MLLAFDQQQLTVAESKQLHLGASISNSGNAPVDLTYQVATLSAKSRVISTNVSAPAHLEPGGSAPVIVGVSLAEDDSPEPLTVRLSAITQGGTASADVMVRFDQRRCAVFARRPELTLNDDGSLTATFTVINCGRLSASFQLRARLGDGTELKIDQPQFSLSAESGPLRITTSLRAPRQTRAGEFEYIECAITDGGEVLAATTSGVSDEPQVDTPNHRSHIAISAILAAAALAIVGWAVGWWGDSRDEPETPQVLATADFDGSADPAEGWVIRGDGDLTQDATADVTDGALVGVDQVTGDTWYFAAPQAFADLLTSDSVISFDLRLDSEPTSRYGAPDLLIASDDAMIYLIHDMLPGAEWTRYEYALADADWRIGALDDDEYLSSEVDPSASVEEVRAVVEAARNLWIRGEHNTGPDTGYLDNVRIIRGQ